MLKHEMTASLQDVYTKHVYVIIWGWECYLALASNAPDIFIMIHETLFFKLPLVSNWDKKNYA